MAFQVLYCTEPANRLDAKGFGFIKTDQTRNRIGKRKISDRIHIPHGCLGVWTYIKCLALLDTSGGSAPG